MGETTITISPEIKQELITLATQVKNNKINDDVQRVLKKVISLLIVENITLKRGNTQLNA